MKAVPHYSVAAECVEDIQAAVKFASKKDLYLVVKNTGHDQLSHFVPETKFTQFLTSSLVSDARAVKVPFLSGHTS